jgi:DNA-binding response OmpR family regulator
MELLLLTTDPEPSSVLPALGMLGHRIHPARPELAALFDTGPCDVVIVDARAELVAVRALCRLIAGAGIAEPVVAVFTEAGLVAVTTDWGLDEILLPTSSPAEVGTRLRLLPPSRQATDPAPAIRRTRPLVRGELIIDEDTHTARIRGTPLALTYLEFALLSHLARHPGRVFTRTELLARVWDPDTRAGTRTVDVHVRRLRAKLGPQHQHLLGTVRNTGYQLIRPGHDTLTTDQQPEAPDPPAPGRP